MKIEIIKKLFKKPLILTHKHTHDTIAHTHTHTHTHLIRLDALAKEFYTCTLPAQLVTTLANSELDVLDPIFSYWRLRRRVSSYLSTTYQLLTNYLSTTYQLLINYLSTTYQLLINYLSTTYQLLINYLSTTYQLLINYLSTNYQLLINYLQYTCNLFLNYLRYTYAILLLYLRSTFDISFKYSIYIASLHVHVHFIYLIAKLPRSRKSNEFSYTRFTCTLSPPIGEPE